MRDGWSYYGQYLKDYCEKILHKTKIGTTNINHGKSTSPSPQILAAVETTF